MNHYKTYVLGFFVFGAAAAVVGEQLVKMLTGSALVALGAGAAIALPVFLVWRWARSLD